MNYSGISECDVLNGTGFRVVLFVSGCSHKCHNCQNPKTWNENFGHPFTEKTKEYLFECLSKDYIDGITLTGGDPLYESNLDNVLSLIKEVRLSFPEKSIWLYTGYRVRLTCRTCVDGIDNYKMKSKYILCTEMPDKNILNDFKRSAILNGVDVVVDGEYIDEQRNLSKKWAGSDNQRVIDIKQSLEQGKVILYCE